VERVSVKGSECARIPADFPVEERAALGNRFFRQEYCCEFVSSDDALFDGDLIRAAFSDDVEPLMLSPY
jgi:hypothetical protein